MGFLDSEKEKFILEWFQKDSNVKVSIREVLTLLSKKYPNNEEGSLDKAIIDTQIRHIFQNIPAPIQQEINIFLLSLVLGFDVSFVMELTQQLYQLFPTMPPFRVAIRAITCIRNILTGDSHTLLGSEIRDFLEELVGEGVLLGEPGYLQEFIARQKRDMEEHKVEIGTHRSRVALGLFEIKNQMLMEEERIDESLSGEEVFHQHLLARLNKFISGSVRRAATRLAARLSRTESSGNESSGNESSGNEASDNESGNPPLSLPASGNERDNEASGNLLDKDDDNASKVKDKTDNEPSGKDDDGNEPSGKDDRYQALAARYFELQRLFKVDDDDDDDDGKPGTSSQVAK